MGIDDFMQKFANDKEFAAKYQAFSSLDDALEEAKKDGYSITKEEALAALQSKGGELTDEELASAAGGKELNRSSCPLCGSPNRTRISARMHGVTFQCCNCLNKYEW